MTDRLQAMTIQQNTIFFLFSDKQTFYKMGVITVINFDIVNIQGQNNKRL